MPLFLILLSSLPLWDLFMPGLPVTHDGRDHVTRIANFYQNLAEGNIVPRWAGNLNWGYGHPILMFLYPLPSYFASLFHFLGFSLVDGLKIVFGLAFILSGITMYLWVKNFLGEYAGFVAALLYMFAPYRFVDLYVRGAVGEHVAFIFPPLILLFLLKASKKYSYFHIFGGSLSLAGLTLSHNAIALMFLPLIFLYALYLFFLNKKGRVLQIYQYTSILVIGFGLAASFWIPAFFEGKYTLRDIVTKGEYASRFVDIKSFLYGDWNYGGTGQFSVQLGIVQWIALLLSAPLTAIFYKRKQAYWILSLGAAVMTLFLLFLMTQYAKPIWESVTTLQKFQFPWRFLSVTVFLTAIITGLLISAFSKKIQIAVVLIITVFVLLFSKDYWHANGYLHMPESFYKSVYDGTTDTGESAPIWSVRFMEKRPKRPMEVIDGNAQIKQIHRTSTSHIYEINSYKDTRIRENTLYFPGWHVYVDSKEVPIEFQDTANRGLMTFFVMNGKHMVNVEFNDTKLRLIANIISGVTMILLFFYIIRRKIWRHFQ